MSIVRVAGSHPEAPICLLVAHFDIAQGEEVESFAIVPESPVQLNA